MNVVRDRAPFHVDGRVLRVSKRGRSSRPGREDHVDPVVAVLVDGRREAGGPDEEDAVASRSRTGQRMQRAAVDAVGVEVSRVTRVVAGVGVVRDHVDRPGADRDRSGEVGILPARSGLVHERRLGERGSRPAPEGAAVRAGVGEVLVEPDALDEPVHVRFELETELDRLRRLRHLRRPGGVAEEGEGPTRARQRRRTALRLELDLGAAGSAAARQNDQTGCEKFGVGHGSPPAASVNSSLQSQTPAVPGTQLRITEPRVAFGSPWG